MSKEPNTIRELFIYMEGEFLRLGAEIDNMKKFVYWIAGITAAAASSICVASVKIAGIL